MSQPKLLRKIVETLDRVGIEYMISGSVVSSLQGEPRATHDIDFVISIESAIAKKLMPAFLPPDYYLDEGSITRAIENKTMFNLIDVNSGDKADFWMLTDEPFDKSRFARKYNEDFAGTEITVSTPEDTILAKLNWAKLCGGSEKQFTDALRVYEVQGEKLDLDYLHTWAKTLAIEPLLEEIEATAEVV